MLRGTAGLPPINKNLWTSSFALLTAAIAAQALAVCHWVLDVERWRRWATPFLAFGRNALAAYFLSVGLDSVLARWVAWPSTATLKWEVYSQAFAWWAEPCCGAELASLAYALAYVAVWCVVVSLMYRRRIFIGI
jgi:predicted acyltransferase